MFAAQVADSDLVALVVGFGGMLVLSILGLAAYVFKQMLKLATAIAKLEEGADDRDRRISRLEQWRDGGGMVWDRPITPTHDA